MITHVWSVICSRSLVDKENNNITLSNIIEQIEIGFSVEPSGVGLIPMDNEIVSFWVRSDPDQPETGRSRVMFEKPDESSLIVSESEIDLVNFERARTRVISNMLQIGSRGRHHFVVQCQQANSQDWQTVARVPLDVKYVIVPQPPSVPSN